MAKTFLKDSTDDKYLENEGNDILEAPDTTSAAAGRYVVEEDGLPVVDDSTGEPYTIEVTE